MIVSRHRVMLSAAPCGEAWAYLEVKVATSDGNVLGAVTLARSAVHELLAGQTVYGDMCVVVGGAPADERRATQRKAPEPGRRRRTVDEPARNELDHKR